MESMTPSPRLLIGGSGAMATALQQHCFARRMVWRTYPGMEENGYRTPDEQERQSFWSETLRYPEVAVYVGSGQQLLPMLRYCEEHQVPLLQCASLPPGLELPRKLETVVVSVPNAALPVMRAIAALRKLVGDDEYQSLPWRITESHQAAKGSLPMTALQIANILRVPAEKIVSIRDPVEQERRGVPREFLNSHAYHWVALDIGGVGIGFVLRIHGKRAYARGMIYLAQKISRSRLVLKPGLYQAETFAGKVWPGDHQ